jgi:hypothetical protein
VVEALVLVALVVVALVVVALVVVALVVVAKRHGSWHCGLLVLVGCKQKKLYP